ALPPTQKLMHTQAFNDARQSALVAIEAAKAAKEQQDIRIRAIAAAGFVAANAVPKKVGGIIKPLMDSVKQEENLDLQRRSAQSVATLVSILSASGRANIASKVANNLCTFLCIDTSE